MKIFALFLCVAGLSSFAQATPSCELARTIFPELQKLRGLSYSGNVACALHDKNQVLAFINAELNKVEVSKKAEFVQVVLRALKVIPADFDYKKQIAELYAGQIGGYYDPKTKRYVMAAWMPEFVQPTVAAHELTHALQDKHYNLQNLLDESRFSSDEILARSALIEGDATMAMYDFLGKSLGQPLLKEQPSVEPYILQTIMGMFITNSGSKIPQLITATLLFPYTSGFRFAHFLARNEGGYKALDAAFKNPPNSSREILFPSQYIERIKRLSAYSQRHALNDPVIKKLRSEDSEKKESISDSLGSFFLSHWMNSFGIVAATANRYAATLSFDKVLVVENAFIHWKLLFDTDKDAFAFESEVCPTLIKEQLKCRIAKEHEERSVVIIEHFESKVSGQRDLKQSRSLKV